MPAGLSSVVCSSGNRPHDEPVTPSNLPEGRPGEPHGPMTQKRNVCTLRTICDHAFDAYLCQLKYTETRSKRARRYVVECSHRPDGFPAMPGKTGAR